MNLRRTLETGGCSSFRCVRSLHGAGLVLRVLRSWRLWRWTGLGHNQRLGPQSRGLELHPHAGRDQGLEGAHGVTCGAGAATDGRLGVGGGPQQDPVDGAEGVSGARRSGAAAASAPRGLTLFQRVQHHVGSMLGRALALQLAQLIQSRVHGFFDVLKGMKEKKKKVWASILN